MTGAGNRLDRVRLPRAAALLLAALAATASSADAERADERRAMVEAVERMALESAYFTRRPRLSSTVLDALGRVPRHLFVPDALGRAAYANRPLPIGEGQTISQPFIVALMTDLLDPEPGTRVLEVGTGSGYQAAVLAELGARVWTIEIVPALAESAAERLRRLGYSKVEVRHGDGYFGWAEAAPFDAVIVTAGAAHVPQPLVDQLAPGGVMVIPVGPVHGVQQLLVIDKRSDGTVETRAVLPVRFVPLTGGPD